MAGNGRKPLHLNEKFWLLLSLILNVIFLSGLFINLNNHSRTSGISGLSSVNTKTTTLPIKKIVVMGRFISHRKRTNDSLTDENNSGSIIPNDETRTSYQTNHTARHEQGTTAIVKTINESSIFIPSNNRNLVIEDMSDYNITYLSSRPSALPCDNDVYLVLVINSSPYNFKQRNFIRRTWGNIPAITALSPVKYEWRVLFLIGQTVAMEINEAVENESRIHGDLILADFLDSTRNLTDKTLLGMLWKRAFCPTAKYFFKGDDDVFVNSYRLLQYVDSLTNEGRKKYFVGRVHRSNQFPCRVKKHKYYVSREDYPRKRFPPYCSGFAYLMTKDCLNSLLQQVHRVKLLKSIDDVYVGLLAEAAGIPPHSNNRRFHFYHPAIPKRHVFSVAEVNVRLAEHGVLTYEKHAELLEKAKKGLQMYQ